MRLAAGATGRPGPVPDGWWWFAGLRHTSFGPGGVIDRRNRLPSMSLPLRGMAPCVHRFSHGSASRAMLAMTPARLPPQGQPEQRQTPPNTRDHTNSYVPKVINPYTARKAEKANFLLHRL